MLDAPRFDSAASIALVAQATRCAVEDALARLEPVATALLRDRYLSTNPPGRAAEAAQKTETTALDHLATALDAVAPAPDGTP